MTERELRARVYELAMTLVPARCTFKSRNLALYRTYFGKKRWRYPARIGVAWKRVEFVAVCDNALVTRVQALAALVEKLEQAAKIA